MQTSFDGGKPPRQYAADYFKATSKEQQRAALAGCPEYYQELVRKHIEIKRLRDKA
jgi:hypothetical protein